MEMRDWDFCMDWIDEQSKRDPKFKEWYEKQIEMNAPRVNLGILKYSG